MTTGQAREVLKHAGLRTTAPRVAVLQTLDAATQPVSHAEIVAALADEVCDRATVYRNLMDLADAGVVVRTDHGDHLWRFELKRDRGTHSQEHPHLVCVDCGDVSCLPGVKVKIVAPAGGKVHTGGDKVEIQLKGHCERCV
jgi:Fur family ferric uptake transcriptional regulator